LLAFRVTIITLRHEVVLVVVICLPKWVPISTRPHGLAERDMTPEHLPSLLNTELPFYKTYDFTVKYG
jgi:hypothetical protein